MSALWHASELFAAVSARAEDALWEAHGVSIDSRAVAPRDLFVAIKGPRHDGHDFLSEAFSKGAVAAIAERAESLSHPILRVPDSHQALIALAAAARQRTKAKIAAVTGSVGKTAVKDGLGLALVSENVSVHVAAGSLNNQWGVPLALARMPAASDFGVFEIGMNHAGEISPLTRLVQPDLVIITDIAEAHLAFFKTLREIAEAKAEIFDGLQPDGSAVLNRDSVFYDFLSDQARKKGAARIVSFGADEQSDVRLVDMDIADNDAYVSARAFDKDVSFRLFMPSRALALNGLAILTAAHLLGEDLSAAARRLSNQRPRAGRGARFKIRLNGKDMILIDESYNANPASMRVAFEVLGNVGGAARRIAILGDMHELGADEVALHKSLAAPLQAVADLVFACGEKMKYLYDLLPESLRGGYAAHPAALIPILQKKLRDDVHEGDILMVKASHASGLERVVAALKEGL